MVGACTATLMRAVPEHASNKIFAIWITFFARPGYRAMETSLSPPS
jgi:hypothetical protein